MLVDDCYYLIDLTRGRYEYPRLKATAIALAQKYRPDCILIEDASTGTALAQELRKSYFDGSVRLVPIERDKIGRLYVQPGEVRGWSRALSQGCAISCRSSRPNC